MTSSAPAPDADWFFAFADEDLTWAEREWADQPEQPDQPDLPGRLDETGQARRWALSRVLGVLLRPLLGVRLRLRAHRAGVTAWARLGRRQALSVLWARVSDLLMVAVVVLVLVLTQVAVHPG